MKIREILKITGARLVSGSSDFDIDPNGIFTDSRLAKRRGIFLALEGPNFDGNKFVKDAFAKGAIGAIVSKVSPDMLKAGKIIIKTDDTLIALQKIAALNRRKCRAPLIAVTGSNGKTTVKELLSSILEKRYNTLKNEGTKNNHIGVPQTLLKLHPDHEICVLELGANHSGEIRRLSEISRPDIAVITNIGPSHLEFFGSLEGVCRAKKEVLDYLSKDGKLIINGDDKFLSGIRTKKFKVIKFGIAQHNDFRASNITLGSGGIKFLVNDKTEFELPILGLHNVYNALAAIAAASWFKVGTDTIREAFSEFKPAKMRLNFKRIKGMDILDDSYNSNPSSMISAIDVVKSYPANNRWVVSGDMLELGKHGVKFHRTIGSYIAKSNIDGLLALGALMRHVIVKAREGGMPSDRLWHCKDHKEMSRILNKVARKGDVILFKGSRGMKMENVIAAL